MNKFSEGEIVILQSTRYPQYDGEYTVSRVYSSPTEVFICRLTGDLFRINLAEQYVYHFDVPFACNKGSDLCFVESSLRKKHKPSELSFTELMTNLSTKIQERI